MNSNSNSNSEPEPDLDPTANNTEIDQGQDINYDEDTWKVINSYFDINRNYLTKHHIESYNDFVLNKIPQTFKQYNPQIIFK